ncbi:hypothetical protein Tco_0663909 [Tanacetum coccineum]
MADLAFVKQHNMVAYLEKTKENTNFYQILDCLTFSLINFSLIVSPTIYASYIERFWNIACLKTINSEKQIHANVDGKAVVVLESSVRRDLHLNDEDGTACLTTNEIFENLALMGYEPAYNKLTFYKGMAFDQEKDVKNQGKIGADDTEVVKGSGDTESINTAGEGVSTASVPETVSTTVARTPPTITTVFDDEDVTMARAQTLIKMKEEKAKEKGVAIKDVEDSYRPIRSITTLQPLPTIDPKDKDKGILQETKLVENTKKEVQGDAHIERDAEVALRFQAELDEELRVERERQEQASKVTIAEMFDEVQARIDADYELVAKMTQEEQEKYTIEERDRLLVEFFERRKKKLAAERAEAIRNKPPTKTQSRNLMMTYLKNMGGYKHSQLKGKSYEEIHGLYERQQKRIQDFTPIDSKKEA